LCLESLTPFEIEWHVGREKFRAIAVVETVLGGAKAEGLQQLFRSGIHRRRDAQFGVDLDYEFEFNAEVTAVAVNDREPKRFTQVSNRFAPVTVPFKRAERVERLNVGAGRQDGDPQFDSPFPHHLQEGRAEMRLQMLFMTVGPFPNSHPNLHVKEFGWQNTVPRGFVEVAGKRLGRIGHPGFFGN
jgi:hypothetical protein